MPVFTGESGPCRWALIQGELDETSVAAFIAHLRGLTEDVRPRQLVLDVLHDVPMPTALQRRQIVEVLQSSDKLDLVAGHALVNNAAIGRGVLTAINWLVRPPFDEKVFSSLDDAALWLQERNPALDPAALAASIRRAYPGFDRLRW